MSTPIFDEAALREITDAAGLEPIELIDLFLDDTRQALAELKAALAGGHYAVVGRIGHTIKSSAGNAGALAVTETARELEYRARGEFEPGGAALCARLEAEFGAFCDLIEGERARLSRG